MKVQSSVAEPVSKCDEQVDPDDNRATLSHEQHEVRGTCVICDDAEETTKRRRPWARKYSKRNACGERYKAANEPEAVD